MLRNPISFIFKLGKARSLPFQPMRSLSAKGATTSLPPSSSPTPSKGPVKIGRSRHSNQMSS